MLLRLNLGRIVKNAGCLVKQRTSYDRKLISVLNQKKTVMKALKFICMLLLVILTVNACQKGDLTLTDELIEMRTPSEPKMVPLKAHWNVVPDYTVPLVTVYFDGEPIGQTAGKYIYTDANVSHLGALDPGLSFSTIEACTALDLNGPVLEFESGEFSVGGLW